MLITPEMVQQAKHRIRSKWLADRAVVAANNILTPVVMVDEIIHSDENPFCEDRTCPCHHSYQYVDMYTTEQILNGLRKAIK